jgi:hypothetical protein
MSNIVVVRGDGYVDAIRRYRVFIDNRERGTVGACEVQTFPVSEGQHKVRMRVDWCSSPEISVDMAKGDVHVLCGPNAPVLLVLFYGLFAWRRWIWLKLA